jgi:hypothetical protein
MKAATQASKFINLIRNRFRNITLINTSATSRNNRNKQFPVTSLHAYRAHTRSLIAFNKYMVSIEQNIQIITTNYFTLK